MSETSDNPMADTWEHLAGEILREIEAADGERAARLEHDAYRLLAERLGRESQGRALLEAAVGGAPGDVDIVFDSFRDSVARDSRTRVAALERLGAVLEDPEDVAAVSLELAQLKTRFLDDSMGAEIDFATAEQAAPDSRNVLLFSLIRSLSTGDDAEALELLARASSLTEDERWRTALQAERVSLLASSGASVEVIGEALERVIESGSADYVALGDAARIAAAKRLHALEARVLERLAGAALTAQPDAAAAPPGRLWDGFSRGEGAATAYLRAAALARERRLGDPEGALELVRRARRLSGSPALASEESRLLVALGRPSEALEALPEDASPAWRSLLALLARRDDDAARFALQATSSALREALVAVADTPHREEGSIEASVADPLAWLHSHPGHADAPALAAELLRDGEDVPYGAKLCLETGEATAEWPTADDRATGGPWVAAVDAIGGPYAGTATAYLEWAARSASPVLAEALRRTAARAAEDAGELARAYDIATSFQESAAGSTGGFVQKARLLRRLGRAPELASLLAEAAHAAEGAQKAALLHERSLLLEYGLDEPGAAADALREATAADPEPGSDALWARARLALRNADLSDAVSAIEEMLPDAGPEAARLHLLAGELCLLALGRSDDAAGHFESAADLGGALGLAARLYLAVAYEWSGKIDALAALYDRIKRETNGLFERLWLPASLETLRALEGRAGVRARLETGAPTGDVAKLWRLVTAAPAEIEQRIRDVAAPDETGSFAEACRFVADALAGARNDFSSAPLSAAAADEPESATDVAERALTRAEALAQDGKTQDALDALLEAAESGVAHPGVLEARARFAFDAGKFAEAAECRIQLAAFFSHREERAGQLAKAAAILFDLAGDAAGAERAVNEALECAPGHPDANDVLTRLLRARGDGEALAKQVEQQIAAAGEVRDVAGLVALYEEKADRLLAIDDVEGAIEAIEAAIEIEPSRLAAHRTRVDLLMVADRRDEAADAMLALAEISEPADKRSALWRAAEFIGTELRDVERAQGVLDKVREEGAPHPITERISAKLYHGASRFEEEAQALSRLADAIEDKAKRVSVLRELSRLALEMLFDTDLSEQALNRALEADPSDLESLKMLGHSRETDDVRRFYDKAFEVIRERIQESPLDPEQISALREVSAMMGDGTRAALCAEATAILAGSPARARTAKPRNAQPNAPLGHIVESIIHPDELACPATSIILEAAQVSAEAFEGAEHLPEVGRATLLRAGGEEPLVAFLKPWAQVIGLDAFEIHRVGFDPRGVMCAPGELAALAVSEDVTDLEDTRARFFLTKGLWRAARGHAAFAEGDLVTPLRWVLALAAATLGEDAKLPIPTDLEMVIKARKALSRKVKKKIADPSKALLACAPQDLRAWVAATAFSADRFGLLAAGDLVGAVPLVVEEAAGDAGLKLLSSQAAETIGKIPRCRELFRFALSGQFLDLERSLGLIDGGGVS
jgi:tetratricopeptide (TPR) repeat protein